MLLGGQTKQKIALAASRLPSVQQHIRLAQVRIGLRSRERDEGHMLRRLHRILDDLLLGRGRQTIQPAQNVIQQYGHQSIGRTSSAAGTMS